MGCCNCCKSTKNIGCFEPCGIVFETGSACPIGMAGEWTLTIKFNRRNMRFKNDLIEGQPVNFLVGCLPDEYTFTAWVEKPDGETAILTIDGQTFDCLQFTTKIEAAAGIAVRATVIT